MPHYLIIGANGETGEDVRTIVYADAESGAREAASARGVFTSSVEALDPDAEPRDNGGEPTALRRLATALSHARRPHEAIIAETEALRMERDAGGCVFARDAKRIPRFLIEAGEADRAWEYLQQLGVGVIPGVGRVPFLPHDLAVAEELKAAFTKPPQSRVHEATARACEALHAMFVGHFNRETTARVVAEAILHANADDSDASTLAAGIVGVLPEYDWRSEPTEQEYVLMFESEGSYERFPSAPFTQAALKAQRAIWEAGTRARDWR